MTINRIRIKGDEYQYIRQDKIYITIIEMNISYHNNRNEHLDNMNVTIIEIQQNCCDISISTDKKKDDEKT